MNEIEARKARAVALLSAWLQDEDPIFDLLEQIRGAVDHFLTCTSQNPCPLSADEHAEDEVAGCCWTECPDCKAYREGTPGLLGTRPTLDLLTELGNRLERREEGAA